MEKEQGRSMATKSKGWVVYPLEDQRVQEFVIPRKSLKSLREHSKRNRETTGLLYGIVDNQVLYFLGCTILGHGSRTACQFDPKYQNFHNSFAVQAKEMHPDLVTILYHNHPRLTPREVSSEVLDAVRHDVERGIFDYLEDHGVLPTLEEALAEVSRELSAQDQQVTFGRGHVLLTDTERKGDDFSRVNAYKFDADGLRGVSRFRLKLLEDVKPVTTHRRVGGICSSLKALHQRTVLDYFGASSGRQCKSTPPEC